MQISELPRHYSHRIIGLEGSRKTDWARRYAASSPWLDKSYLPQTSQVEYAAGITRSPTDVRPPFRAPHCTATSNAMMGCLTNGWYTYPGEASLANGGVLYLHEAEEFHPTVLRLIAQVHEDRSVVLWHGDSCVILPAHFTLIIGSRPCPCRLPVGQQCACTRKAIARYQERLPPPLRGLPIIDFELEEKE